MSHRQLNHDSTACFEMQAFFEKDVYKRQLLLWGLKILIRATDLVLKLPGLHLANSLGGGARCV